MTEIADRLQKLKDDEAAVDAAIRAAVEKSGTRPPLRNPADVARDRRMPKGRTR
jgi:hypothetical protein